MVADESRKLKFNENAGIGESGVFSTCLVEPILEQQHEVDKGFS